MAIGITNAAILRRRRRGISTVITDVVAAELVWIDGPPTLNAIGATANSRAVVRNAEHQVLSALTPTYVSGTPSNVTIDANGLCTAVANGTSVITASYAGVTSITQTATVSQTVASISGVSSTLATNDLGSGTFSPVGKDANNNTVSGATFAYSSDQPSILSVNASTGAWAGQSAGTAHVTITASPGGATFVVTATVAHVTYTLTVTPNPITGSSGSTVQLTVTEDTGSGPVDVTADSGTVYSIADTSKATVDVPTLTSISPNTITQGTNASYTFAGTNIKGTETIGGLPTGVTASSYSYTSTTVVCTLTATAGATTGAASVSLLASGRGQSGTQTLTVNSAVSTPTLTSVAPNALVQGTTNRLVTLTGTNFDTNCTAVFSNAGITVVSYGTITSTSLPVYITISAGAATGSGTVKVHQSGGGGLDSGTQAFTVSASGYPSQLTRAWEADSGLDTTTNGAGVGTWTDQIGGTAQWSQATAGSKPTNANATLNGLNVLQFSGSQSMSGTLASMGLNGTTHTVYLLVECDVNDAVWRGVLDNSDPTAHTGYRFKHNDSSQWKAEDGNGTTFGGMLTTTATVGQWVLLAVALDNVSSGNNGGYVNGTLNGGGLLYSPNTTNNPLLGADYESESNFKGKLAAIYASAGVDSSTQRTNVKAYVNSKWGTAF